DLPEAHVLHTQAPEGGAGQLRRLRLPYQWLQARGVAEPDGVGGSVGRRVGEPGLPAGAVPADVLRAPGPLQCFWKEERFDLGRRPVVAIAGQAEDDAVGRYLLAELVERLFDPRVTGDGSRLTRQAVLVIGHQDQPV